MGIWNWDWDKDMTFNEIVKGNWDEDMYYVMVIGFKKGWGLLWDCG